MARNRNRTNRNKPTDNSLAVIKPTKNPANDGQAIIKPTKHNDSTNASGELTTEPVKFKLDDLTPSNDKQQRIFDRVKSYINAGRNLVVEFETNVGEYYSGDSMNPSNLCFYINCLRVRPQIQKQVLQLLPLMTAINFSLDEDTGNRTAKNAEGITKEDKKQGRAALEAFKALELTTFQKHPLFKKEKAVYDLSKEIKAFDKQIKKMVEAGSSALQLHNLVDSYFNKQEKAETKKEDDKVVNIPPAEYLAESSNDSKEEQKQTG